jgi:hypothetical protein
MYLAGEQLSPRGLGGGLWDEMMTIVYSPLSVDPTIEFRQVIEFLSKIQDEPWTKALHLD